MGLGFLFRCVWNLGLLELTLHVSRPPYLEDVLK